MVGGCGEIDKEKERESYIDISDTSKSAHKTDEKRKAAVNAKDKKGEKGKGDKGGSKHHPGRGIWNADVGREQEMSSSPRASAQWKLETSAQVCACV